VERAGDGLSEILYLPSRVKYPAILEGGRIFHFFLALYGKSVYYMNEKPKNNRECDLLCNLM
jgi:hypothetical protein